MGTLAKRRKSHFSDFEKPPTVPSLGQMICDARGDQQVIRRATQSALRAWFRQSERLDIARREYKLRDHGLPTSPGGSGSPIRHRGINWSICIAIARRSSGGVLTTLPMRSSVDRYTVIPVAEWRLAGFTRPNALSDAAAIGSRHLLCGASSMPSSILTTPRAQPAA